MAHIGDFDVRNSSARRNFLELAFESELGERVYLFAHVYVVAVGVVTLVRYVGNASELLLVYPCKAVTKRFRGGAVEREADVCFLLPLFAVLAERLHNFECEFGSFGLSVGYSLDELCYLVKPYVSERNRRISAEEELVYLFAGLQPRNCAVLPVNGRHVARHAFQRVMTAHYSLEAKLHSLFENLPEFLFVALCEYAYLGKIDRHDTLIEPALEFVVAVFVLPRGEERTAPHRREYVAFVMLAHFLCRNVIGVKTLGRTLDRKLGEVVVLSAFKTVVLVQNVNEFGERRRDVDALFVLDTLIALFQYLLDYHCVFFYVLVFFVEIEEQRHERRLSVCRHKRVYLILNSLNACFKRFLQAHIDEFFLGLFVHVAAELLVALRLVLLSRQS